VAVRIIHLARLFALIAVGRPSRLKSEIVRARRAGLSLVQVKELFLQSYLLVGYPRMINAFLTLASLPGTGGGAPSERGLTPKRARARGERNCRAIYGDQAEPMLARMREMHPDLAEWIVCEGYGKVLGRRWLAPVERELASLPVLALQGVRKQLYSHLRGALRVGASRARIRSVLRACRGIVPASRLRMAGRMLLDL